MMYIIEPEAKVVTRENLTISWQTRNATRLVTGHANNDQPAEDTHASAE